MSTPIMPPPWHQSHEAPLQWLVREKIHPGTVLADRVRRLRYKRRKVKPATSEPLPSFAELREGAGEKQL